MIDARSIARGHEKWSHAAGYTVHMDADQAGFVVHGWLRDGLIHPGSTHAASNGRSVSVRPEGRTWRAVRVDLGERLGMSSRTVVDEDDLEAEFAWARGDL